MHNLSRAGFVVSIFALLVAAAAPFVTYYWLQNELRIRELKAEQFAATGFVLDCREDFGAGPVIYGLKVVNNGPLPIDKLKVKVSELPDYRSVSRFDLKDISINPPLDLSTEENGNIIAIAFKDSIPPNSAVFLTIATRQVESEEIADAFRPDVWIYSDVSSGELNWQQDKKVNGSEYCPPEEHN